MIHTRQNNRGKLRAAGTVRAYRGKVTGYVIPEDAGPIIREFAGASRIAAATGTALVVVVAQLDESRARMQGLRSDAAAWKVLPALVGRAAVHTKHLTNVLGIGGMAALRALESLTERGVLTEMTGSARGRFWQHRGTFDVLDGYAAGIRRMPLC